MYYVIIFTLLVCIKCGNLTIKLTSILLPSNIQDQVCKVKINTIEKVLTSFLYGETFRGILLKCNIKSMALHIIV